MEPLTESEVDLRFSPFRRFRVLVLAVSGGADSTALMHAAASYAVRHPHEARALLAVTIDHGLRADGAAEARLVAAQAAALGLAHRIIGWEGAKPKSALQAMARKARYDRLFDVAIQASLETGGPAAIVTAHTADDQAETLLMRLARGSGIDGLAAIPSEGRLDRLSPDGRQQTVAILRPWLDVRRQRLLATLAAANIAFSNDPSNDDTRFERVRIRQAMPILESLGFSRIALARTATRLQAAKSALDRAADSLAAGAVGVAFDLVHSIDRSRLASAPADIGLRVFRRVLAAAGGTARPADLAAVEQAFHRLMDEGPRPRPTTLGGCIIEAWGATDAAPAAILVYREPGRKGGLASMRLNPGESALWDGRVWASLAPEAPHSVEFGPMGEHWHRLIDRHPCLAKLPLPAAAGRGLPAFQLDGAVMAVPSLVDWARIHGDREAVATCEGPLLALPVTHTDTRRALYQARTVPHLSSISDIDP